MEAADAGIRLICSITDGIPAQDMMRVKRYLMRYPKDRRPMMVGPNCAGIISPGKAMLGIMPGHIYLQGRVGVISRSGTLGYEAASQMKAKGIGITTSVGIGGDPINGSSFLDHLALFEEDPETDAVLMIGEIGGPQEAEASAWIKDNMSKPVIGFVAGSTAPKGRRMGHAGAIISAAGDSAAEKAEIMRSCGLTVAPNPSEFGSTVAGVLASRPGAPRRSLDRRAGALRAAGAISSVMSGSAPAIHVFDCHRAITRCPTSQPDNDPIWTDCAIRLMIGRSARPRSRKPIEAIGSVLASP